MVIYLGFSVKNTVSFAHLFEMDNKHFIPLFLVFYGYNDYYIIFNIIIIYIIIIYLL